MLAKKPQTDHRSSSTNRKKQKKKVEKSPQCTLYSLNTAKNLPFLQLKYPKGKKVRGGRGLLSGQVNSAINAVSWYTFYVRTWHGVPLKGKSISCHFIG